MPPHLDHPPSLAERARRADRAAERARQEDLDAQDLRSRSLRVAGIGAFIVTVVWLVSVNAYELTNWLHRLLLG